MGKCSFNSTWLSKTDDAGYKVSQWARKEDENSVYCTICENIININKGYQALMQHASTNKHKEQINFKLNPLQLRLVNACEPKEDDSLIGNKLNKDVCGGNIYLYSIKDAATTAELVWTLKMVSSNYSASSSSGISDVFKTMFPNSIPEGFCINPKKVHYLISDGLAPYFKKKIMEDVRGAYYCLMYDETTNSANKKELQTVIRYWSKTQNRVVSQHLQTFFLGSATADVVCGKIIEAMDQLQLPRNRLLMLGSDGPNVNKKVHKLMNEELKIVCERSLVDIGTCNVHIVHNAFLKGISELGEDACELITAVYNFFDGWPSRWEAFVNVQNKEGVANNRFIKHCTSRWLTVEPAAKRLLEQWAAIKSYFLSYIPSKGPVTGVKYVNIFNLLKKSTIKAELNFLISSANLFTKFTRAFQKDEPLVHILHSELITLVQTLAGRFCKNFSLDLCKLGSILEENNFLPLRQINCSEAVMKELQNVNEKDKMLFLKDVQKHYVNACKVIMEKTAISSGFLKRLRFLHPSERKTTRSCRDIVAVSQHLQIDEVQDDVLLDEWKALQLEKDTLVDEKIDLYWNTLLSIRNHTGDIKYGTVGKVVKAALVLSHGNAEVERGFSSSGRVLTDDRASMCERTLDSIMRVKSMLKMYNNQAELVPITKELLVFARNAHKSYENYLYEQKQIREKEQKKKREEEEIVAKEKADSEHLLKQKEIIKKCEESLQKKREREGDIRKTADKLFAEATERLKKGVKDKNMQEISLANAMLDAVTSQRKEEQKERDEGDKIQKTLEKRKATFLDKYVLKKPRNNK